jgi:coenzyme F420 biosynthesis associated uncharacterized protein
MDKDRVILAAERLVDWNTARMVGGQVTGTSAPLTSTDRARLAEDFAEVVSEAESIVSDFAGLQAGDYPSRAWVMTRKEWLDANLRGFERVLEPFARKLMDGKNNGGVGVVRRHVLGAQIGGLLGYLGRRVLGQYDVFAPPDDDGLIYFVGGNIAGLERRFKFPQREFRLWLAFHETCHRLQFGGVSWLRPFLSESVERYLTSVELDPRWLLDRLENAVREVRSGGFDQRGLGWFALLMTEDQRDMVRRMQAMMSLLEGHATFVMNSVVRERLPQAALFHRVLHERRTKPGVEKAFQKVIGFDVKVRQYDQGERFVASVVQSVGMARFNRIWESPTNLPTIEEVARPELWVARVAAV